MQGVYKKYRSRTWILSIIASAMVFLSIVIKMIYPDVDVSWLNELTIAYGIIVGAYVGGEKYVDGRRNKDK